MDNLSSENSTSVTTAKPRPSRKELRERAAAKMATATDSVGAAVSERPEPTQAEIDAWLAKTGQKIVPVADAPVLSDATKKREHPLKSIIQRTEREAYAIPLEEDPNVKEFHAHPDYRYVRVQFDSEAGSERGPSFYRAHGWGRIEDGREEGQDMVLIMTDGSREEVRPGQILMARLESKCRDEEEAERKKNDPHRHNPADHMQAQGKDGHFYQEQRPLKFNNLVDELPGVAQEPVEAARARVERNPMAREALARIEEAAEKLTED